MLYAYPAMKTEHTYRWLTRWAGKMSPTRYHCTEEQIRKSHPEAVRIEGTLIVRQVAETVDELPKQMTSPPMPQGKP